ncbi:hypothetical protein Q8A73_005134 [Channa argus]|nr:hypothetical protein Q8A73_005134 [Channa argus]
MDSEGQTISNQCLDPEAESNSSCSVRQTSNRSNCVFIDGQQVAEQPFGSLRHLSYTKEKLAKYNVPVVGRLSERYCSELRSSVQRHQCGDPADVTGCAALSVYLQAAPRRILRRTRPDRKGRRTHTQPDH